MQRKQSKPYAKRSGDVLQLVEYVWLRYSFSGREGEPAVQLSTTLLWAIMLRNSTAVFISWSTGRKFLETLQAVLLNPDTDPAVKSRLMDVVQAAAYASRGSSALL